MVDVPVHYPRIGVLAVVMREGRFLLVRRGKAPNKGLWGFPGGSQEWGETVFEAALRELGEETGLSAEAPRLLTVLDAIDRDDGGDTIRHHYTLVAVGLTWLAGEGEAGDDAEETGWFGPEDLASIRAVPRVLDVMRLALGA